MSFYRKKIYLNFDPEYWKIEMLMVHEICHAQKGCKSHGDQWKKKMQEAAYRCESAGISSCGPDTSRNWKLLILVVMDRFYAGNK